MKLLNKSALYNFILSLCIIAVGGVSFYIILLRFADEDATEKLYTEQVRVRKEAALIDSIPAHSPVLNSDIRFARIGAGDSVRQEIRDTVVHERYDNDDEDVPYRIINYSARTRLYHYKVTMRQSLIESEGLITKMANAVFVLLIIYLILLVMLNRVISKKLWKPFYNTLDELKAFDIQNGDPVGRSQSNTDEFRSLNEALKQMTEKIKGDYNNLKEFTENASHEIQTPLSIIRSKIELMLQAENVSESDWKNLEIINEAASRLSKLNQALLLLSRIENKQFAPEAAVNLSTSLHKQIENLNELISAKGLTLHIDIKADILIPVHPYLLDILLGNILMNAVRHNISGGFINIHLREGMLSVQNSGEVLNTDPQQLFLRFKKGNTNIDSIGIGLSLVQKIAEASGLDLRYTYQERIHTILLKF